MKDEILSKIINDYENLIKERDLFFKNVACYVSSDSYMHMDDGLKKVLKFANKSDDEILNLAYENNYSLIDQEREHVYICLASFIKSNNKLFPDFCVEHDNNRVDYTDYVELIGTPTRVRILIDERDDFENNNEILYLGEYEPYSVCYDMRFNYLKNIISYGHEDAINKLKEKNKTR